MVIFFWMVVEVEDMHQDNSGSWFELLSEQVETNFLI